ncbi:hypothetical protein AcV5_001486 [Taiwanofungus camphoratus]|nr:hypothetical protein AcV5_001486 [Antrodia cinnamomea]
MLPIHATDGPVLALSDIMHTLSPSPVPQPPLPSESGQPPNVHVIYNENSHPPAQNGIFSSQLDSSHGLSPSPEPLDYSDVELMRSRIHELGLVGSHVSNFNTSATERELANMVLRLISHLALQPLPSQLALQAETIAQLAVQRNFLLQERENQHARWDAERESWDRTAEALIGKRRAASDAAERDYATERQISHLRDDNLALRHKLADAHTRMSTLESELARLRPLLLMQPTLLRDPSLLQFPAFLQFGHSDTKADAKKKRRGKRDKEREEKVKDEKGKNKEKDGQASTEVDADADVDTDINMDAGGLEGGDQTHTPRLHTRPDSDSIRSPYKLHIANAQEGDPFGFPLNVDTSPRSYKQAVVKSDKRSKAQEKKGRGKTSDDRGGPLLSDARAECLLVAARKIGRVRAAMAAKEREAEREREREIEKKKEQEQECEREQERQRGRERVLDLSEAREPQSTESGVMALANEQTHKPEHVRMMGSIDNHWEYRWYDDYAPEAGPSTYNTHSRTPPTPPVPTSSTRRGATPPRRAGSSVQLPSHLHPSMQQLPSTPRHMPPQSIHPHQSSLSMATGPPHVLPPGIVYMHSPIAVPVPTGRGAGPGQPAPAVPLLVPIPSGTWPVPSTPTKHVQPVTLSQTPVENVGAEGAPATPLDSLLSAARSMMVDEDRDESRRGRRTGSKSSKRRKAAAAMEMPESPVPKRRKAGSGSLLPTASPSTSGNGSRTTRRQVKAPGVNETKPEKKAKDKEKDTIQDKQDKAVGGPPSMSLPLTRVRSALDVLADQAAQEQERWPPSGPASVEPDRLQTTKAPRISSPTGSTRRRAASRKSDSPVVSSTHGSTMEDNTSPRRPASPVDPNRTCGDADLRMSVGASTLTPVEPIYVPKYFDSTAHSTNSTRRENTSKGQRPPSAPPAPILSSAHTSDVTCFSVTPHRSAPSGLRRELQRLDDHRDEDEPRQRHGDSEEDFVLLLRSRAHAARNGGRGIRIRRFHLRWGRSVCPMQLMSVRPL